MFLADESELTYLVLCFLLLLLRLTSDGLVSSSDESELTDDIVESSELL